MKWDTFFSVLFRLAVVGGLVTAQRWWRGDYEEKPQLKAELKFDWRESTKDRWTVSPYLPLEPKKAEQERSSR